VYESFNLYPIYTPNSGSLKTSGSRNLSDPGTKTSLKDQVSLGACKPFFRSTKDRHAGPFFIGLVGNNAMHKPTPSRVKSRLESASTPAMRFLRKKHTFDPNRVQFWHFGRKVAAIYFPLFEIEAAKMPRKTASRVRRVESTFHSKKTKQWKVQTAQKTRRNSPLGHARLESGGSEPARWPNRVCNTYRPDCILSFTLHYSKFTIYSLSTTCGDIQQKSRHAIFSEVETSMKMIFHSSGENQRAARRKREPLSKTPLLFFH
jgi:hypothetical protein